MITENLQTLKIHQLTSEQYKRERDAGRIDNTALYLTPDETVLVVTVDNDTQTASHTSTEIYEHIQAGGAVVALMENRYFPMTRSASGEAEFVPYLEDEDMFYGVKIFSDGTCERVQVDMITNVILNEKLGDIAPLIVTLEVVFDSNSTPTIKASHTYHQIYEHLQKGGDAMIKDGDYFHYYTTSFTISSENELETDIHIVRFASRPYAFEADDCWVSFIDVDDYGNATLFGHQLATAEQIGDISSALDELHNKIAPLIVTLDEDTGKASHNSTAIFSIYDSGTSVQLSAFGGYAPISHLTPDESAFMLFDGAEQVSIKIYKDGNYVVWTHEFATVDEIGDISSALDEIREYAENLVNGGGSV